MTDWDNMVSRAGFRKGDLVRVVKGRKVPHGVEGIIFWMKDTHFGQSYSGMDGSTVTSRDYGRWVTRVGIKDAAGNVYWTYDYNLVHADKAPTPTPHDHARAFIHMNDREDFLTLDQLKAEKKKVIITAYPLEVAA